MSDGCLCIPGAAGNRYSTIVERESHLRLHLRAAFGKLRLDAIGREDIARFYAEMTKKGLSPKSRKNIGGTLRTILGTAVEWEVIEKLPRFPRVKVPDAPWDFYTREESELLLSKTRSAEERAVLQFPLHTGARAGEQIAFEWRDIDWHNRLVIIRRSSALGRVGPTKSGKDRKVPMTADLQAALKAIKHLRSPLVFCNEDGRPLTKWQLHERLWGTARRAGLRGERRGPHPGPGIRAGGAKPRQPDGNSGWLTGDDANLSCDLRYLSGDPNGN
jgi:integrase